MCALRTDRWDRGRVALFELLLAVCVMCCPALAQCEEPALGQADWVEIQFAGDRTVRAVVARPAAVTQAPVVLILHEDRGLTKWERRLASELAEAGHIAIAPDLLSEAAGKGSGTESFDTVAAARAAVYDIKPDMVADELDSVFAYARGLPGGARDVVIVGFGWGGTQAFLYAAHNPEVAATAVFYGASPTEEQMRRIKSPVFGFYAENDTRITDEVAKVKRQMREAGGTLQAVTYAGAGHGFFRAGEARDASPADRQARSDAWLRLVKILKDCDDR